MTDGPSTKVAAPRPNVGVATMTPIAFTANGTLYLERMNLLSEEGAGILCQDLPAVGEILPVIFRLSTAPTPVRCKAEVLASIPTTPSGLSLRTTHGEQAMLAAIGAASAGDSATMMFRMSDLKPLLSRPPPPPARSTPSALHGFCIRFLDMTKEDKDAVARHVKTSRHLSETLNKRGEQMIAVIDDERATLASAFEDGNLAQRAKDW